eukprot:COSAG02_NODE_61517_length_268_cov_0.798817_2_plen_62_part_01
MTSSDALAVHSLKAKDAGLAKVSCVVLLAPTHSRVGKIGFFKQKTAYEMESRDWSSDVCSSD